MTDKNTTSKSENKSNHKHESKKEETHGELEQNKLNQNETIVATKNTTPKSENKSNNEQKCKKKENGSDSESTSESEDDDFDPYLIVLCDGGVTKKVLKRGEGVKPPLGAQVVVHYTGTLQSNGSKFDSSRDREEPFEFELGKGSVIKGWNIGIASMKTGERSLLTCREDFAYGKKGKPPNIPGGATLVFDVELISFKEKGEDITRDGGGVIKKRIRKGEGLDRPSDTGKCIVKYTGQAQNGKIFTKHDAEEKVELNIDKDLTMTRGLTIALQSMVKGEKSVFRTKSSYCYGSKGNKELEVPPDSDIIYNIELISFENGKKPSDMDTKEKIQLMTERKDKGNTCYKKKHYLKGIYFYNISITTFKEGQEKGLSDKQKKTIQNIRLACYSNIALCELKGKRYAEAIKSCDKGLAIRKDHNKLLFRRGQARAEMGDDAAALRDLKAAKKLSPDDKMIEKLFITVRKRLKKQKKKEKDIYTGLFDKTTLANDMPDPKSTSHKTVPKQFTQPKDTHTTVDYSKWDNLEDSDSDKNESKEPQTEQEKMMAQVRAVAKDCGMAGQFFDPRNT